MAAAFSWPAAAGEAQDEPAAGVPVPPSVPAVPPQPAPVEPPATPGTQAPASESSGKPGPGAGDEAGRKTEEIQFFAVHQYLLRKERAVILSGSAWVAAHGVLLEAEHIVVWQKERQAYGQGAVRLTEAGGRLLADEIFYDFGAERGRATGVRLEIGKVEEVPGERTGPAEMPKLGGDRPGGAVFGSGAPAKWYVTAPEVRRAGPGRWQIVKPRVSSCDFAKPHWCFEASSADYYPGRKVQSFNNVLYLGPVPVFYLPYVARDLSHDYPWTTWQVGKSGEWGYYALSKWGFDLPSGDSWLFQPRNLKLDLDYRQDRGWAYGGGVYYDVLPHGSGFVDTYRLREDLITAEEDRERADDEIERRSLIYQNLRTFGAPKVIGSPKRLFEENLLFARRRAADGYEPPDLDRDLYENEERYSVHWLHRQDLLPVRDEFHDGPVYALDLTAELFDYSDRDFRREYFRSDYRLAPEPLSFAMLRHQGNSGSLWLTVEPQTNPFVTTTERLPQLGYDVIPQRLPGGFFVSSSGDLGYLRRRFDEDSGFEDFESGRGHVQVVADRPVKIGPIGFSPYVGTDQSWYSDSREGANLIQGAALYGADAAMRLYGTFSAESDLLNVHGLRHVVEPRLFFRGVSEPTHDPVSILDFDPVDDLAKSNVAGAALVQTLQTRRRAADGTEHVSDLAGLSFTASGFVDRDEAERLNEDDMLLPYRVRAFVSPVDNLKLWGSAEIDAHGVGLARYTEGVSYSQPGLFAAGLRLTTVCSDPEHDIDSSQYLTGTMEVPLSEHWRVAAVSSYEFDHPNEELGDRGFGDTRIGFFRDFHCWLLGIDYSINRMNDGERERTIGATLTATPRPVNLVKGSDQLLFESPAYGREAWLFRPAEPQGELRVVPPPQPPPTTNSAPDK